VLGDDIAPVAPPAQPDRDPLDVLLEPPSGWRRRLDELTGGLGFLPGGWRAMPTPTRAAGVAIVAVVVLAGAFVSGVLPGGARNRSTSPTSIVLPRATAGSSRVPAPDTTGGAPVGTTAPGIWVAAAGAVVHPGLYRLRPEARVSELLNAAGCLALDADGDRINLAAVLRDGQRLYVPRRGEQSVPTVVTGDGGSSGGQVDAAGTGAGGSSDPAVPSAEHPVNLNTATVTELDTLPGVGPATAASIVDYRTKNGPFASVDDLRLVRGIGPAKLAQLRDLVTV
jgi:competence protein ComEA